MTFIVTYIVFALTTAITALIEILAPVIHKREQDTQKHVADKVILYVTFFIITVLFAPAIFLNCIIPSMNERFKSSLYSGLFAQD